MSAIEDVRKVIQDFVAPALKSLETRVSSLESAMNQRFASAEAVALARHEAILAQIAQLSSTVAANHAAVLTKLDLDRRVERIESTLAPIRVERAESA